MLKLYHQDKDSTPLEMERKLQQELIRRQPLIDIKTTDVYGVGQFW